MATKKSDVADGAANHTTETVTVSNSGDAPKTEGGEQANIPAATEFDPSGAPVQTVPDVDPKHPAVDNDPRKGTTVDQNRIDFNDPTKTGAEAVAENLREQGQDVFSEAKSED